MAALAVMAAPAGADSIVFIKAGDVWLANGDGSGQYRVTSGGGYSSPSQADDGTIMAVRGAGGSAQFHRMRQNGQVLNSFATPSPSTPRGVEISPNGALIAFHWLSHHLDPDTTTHVAYADRFTPYEQLLYPGHFDSPVWLDNSNVFLSYGASLTFSYRLGDPDPLQWFADIDYTITDPDITRHANPAANRIVAVHNRDHPSEDEQLVFFQATGAPPADPVAKCLFHGPPGVPFHDPSWAPSGNRLAWQAPDGIYLVTVGSLDNCPTAFSDIALKIPGGTEPDYGPANVNPGAGGPGGPGGGSGGTGSATLSIRVPRTLALARALRRGFSFRFGSNQPGRVGAAATVSRTVARRMRVRRTVARGSKTLAGPSTVRVKMRFTRSAKRRLRRARRVRLVLKATFRDSAGRKRSISRRLTLRR